MSLDVHSHSSAPADVFRYLRTETDLLHRRLERNLRLLTPPTQERFVFALTRFLGFHRVWEPAVVQFAALAPLFEGRGRLRHIEHDLAALGVSTADIAAAPPCAAAAALGATVEHAMGSLYVMEGSTLGGAAIGRALEKQAWLPQTGLGYFTPPGRDVHAEWRGLREWAQAAWPVSAWPALAAGARDTFSALDAWISTTTIQGSA